MNNQDVDNEKLTEEYSPTDGVFVRVVLHTYITVQQVPARAGTMIAELMS